VSHFAELDQLLQRKNQRFICKDTGWPIPDLERHTAPITHETTPPLGQVEIDRLKAQIPEVLALAELYSKYGSIRLYCSTVFYEPLGRYPSAFYIDPHHQKRTAQEANDCLKLASNSIGL
jgi:hypothetical protein